MQQGFWTLLKWWKVMMYIRKWDALFFFPQDEGLFFLMLLTLLFFEGKYPNVKKKGDDFTKDTFLCISSRKLLLKLLNALSIDNAWLTNTSQCPELYWNFHKNQECIENHQSSL